MGIMNADNERLLHNNKVGPLLRPGEICDAAIEAIRMDNPDKEFIIKDEFAYFRVETNQECVIRRETMEKLLGRPFDLQELGVALAGFAGQIDFGTATARFYLEEVL
jgi:toluene monooxygenase system protein D